MAASEQGSVDVGMFTTVTLDHRRASTCVVSAAELVIRSLLGLMMIEGDSRNCDTSSFPTMLISRYLSTTPRAGI